jgi:hypothetical protein
MAEPDPEPDLTQGLVQSEPGPNPNPDQTMASLVQVVQGNCWGI